MGEYSNLSETELQAVIDNAEKALKDKQSKKRKDVIAQIKELAASIGVTVDIQDAEKKNVKIRMILMITGSSPKYAANPEPTPPTILLSGSR